MEGLPHVRQLQHLAHHVLGVIAPFDHPGKCNLRILRRGEPDHKGVRTPGGLGGTGLDGSLKPQVGQGILLRHGALGGKNHALPDQRIHRVILHIDLFCDHRLGLRDQLGACVVVHTIHQVGTIAHPFVGNGGCRHRHLQGCYLHLGLTDGSLEHITCVPGHLQLFKGLGICQPSGSVPGLQPQGLPQAVVSSILGNSVDAQPLGKLIEEDVAGHLNGTGHIDGRVVAGTMHRTVQVLIVSGTEISGAGVDDPRIQPCRSGDGLEGGAGSVQTIRRPVDQRGVLPVQHGLIVIHQILQVIGGSGRHTQHRIGLHVQHHQRPGGNLVICRIVQIPQVLHHILQYPLKPPLEFTVHRQLHPVAAYSLLGDLGGSHFAVHIGDLLDPVRAPQLLLQCQFQSAFPHRIRQQIAVPVFLQLLKFLLAVDGAHSTDLMGQDITLLDGADGFLDHVKARQL